MPIKPVLRGIATYVPFIKRFTNRGSGGTNSARYCYAVWMRHLIRLHAAGMRWPVSTIAELGPGDSLGTGMAALLSGADSYCALDALPYPGNASNAAIFDELVDMFRRRASVPGPDEFPQTRPLLDSYEFPRHILDDALLAKSLREERLLTLNRDLEDPSDLQRPSSIRFYAPWHNSDLLPPNSVELLFSQAVMEHVMDLDITYEVINRWLRPSGYQSHTIDYRAHHTSKHWNGHWGYSDWAWKLVVGKRVFLLNRKPHSAHIDNLRRLGFEVVVNMPEINRTGLDRSALAKRFRQLSDEDVVTANSFIIARKPDELTDCV